jgi:hypothetical protein
MISSRHRLLILTIAATISFAQANAQQAQKTDAPSVKIINGLWFDGARFVPRTVYMSHGVFTSQPTHAPDSVIDAHGGYIVPPFAEAHNHNIDASSPEAAKALVAKYMQDGVFYGQNPSNVLRARTGLKGFINVPSGLDATFSNAGLTGPGGHPIGLFLRNLGRGVMLATDSNTTEGFVWTIRDRADLDRKWPLVLASKPDFIKVLMLYSDQYEKRLNDTAYFNWRGIDPKLVVEIAKRAHAKGLRVMAHVETAADFRNALAARVDEIGHTPGFRGNEKSQLPDLAPYELTDADAEWAARQGAYVVTTLGGIVGVPDTALRKRADSLFARNLHVMKKHHVKVIVGSDSYRNTSMPEALYLSTLGVYTNAELLRLWTEDTPRAIFPNRRIGKLVPGYESSFLVLDKNPLTDFGNVQTIRLRVKQGFTIQ